MVEPEKSVYGISYRESGKRNENLTMALHIAVPFKSKVNAWYGISYYKRISNHLDDDEKKSELKKFIRDKNQMFSQYNFYHKNYFELLSASDKRDRLKETIDRAHPESKDLPVYILRAYENPFNERDSDTKNDLFGSSFFLILIIYLTLLKTKVSKQYLLKYSRQKKHSN